MALEAINAYLVKDIYPEIVPCTASNGSVGPLVRFLLSEKQRPRRLARGNDPINRLARWKPPRRSARGGRAVANHDGPAPKRPSQ